MTRTLKKIYLAGFVGILLVLCAASINGLNSKQTLSDYSVINGELAREVENHYDQVFPVKTLGTNLWASLEYLIFDEGRDGVFVGKDEWLFTSEEISPTANDQAQIELNLKMIASVVALLRQQEIDVVMAVVPAKARVYSEFLDEVTMSRIRQPLYWQFHKFLALQGIPAPDLLTSLSNAKKNSRMYFRTDTHWTPEGADVAAIEVSAAIEKQFAIAHDQSFTTEVSEVRIHRGDLLSYIPMDPWFEGWMPAVDEIKPRKTFANGDSQGIQEEALFGETGNDVVLVGTSYSANALWNFEGALKQHLKADVINYAQEGKGPIEPMLAYLSGDDFANSPPSLLIWEFPERYLPMAYDDETIDPSLLAELEKFQPAEIIYQFNVQHYQSKANNNSAGLAESPINSLM